MARFFCNGIAIDTFDVGADRNALFCNGLPGAIGPLPAVLAANRAGWNVLFMQYPGTYDSNGDFSIARTVALLDEVLRSFADGTLTEPSSGALSQTRPPVSLAIGHSFGGYILTELFRAAPETTIRKALLLAPVFTYRSEPDVGVREDLLQHLEYVKASRPFTYRFGDSDGWGRAASGHYLAGGSAAWSGDVLALIGADDDTFDPEIVAANFPGFYEAETGASSARISIVPGAGHGMDELLEQEAAEFLK